MTEGVMGSTVLAEGLRARGVGSVFSVPGSQSVPTLEAFRGAGLRILCGSSELTTSFMAVGHAAHTRRPAVLVTIPGPGFTYALSGVAEARLDSLPLVWLALAAGEAPDGRPTLQAIPQLQMAQGLVKKLVRVSEPEEVPAALDEAFHAARFGEPGPVMVHLAPEALGGKVSPEAQREPTVRRAGSVDSVSPRADPPDPESLEEGVERLRTARRPLLLVGQGGLDAPAAVSELAHRLRAPVITTTSARGVISELNDLVMAVDHPGTGVGEVNALLSEADLVVGLGVGLSHNGSHGFALELPPERFLRVDASPDAFRPPYRAGIELCCDVRTFLERVGEAAPSSSGPSGGWTSEELVRWKERLEKGPDVEALDPVVAGVSNGSASELFRALMGALPADAVVVTDSGRHQMLARIHLRIRSPGGLLVPADFQSMGFGVPAAMGVKHAAPDRQVVAIVGDGGLQITMAELLVARREKLPVRIVVFTDGEFGLIADHQRRDHGRTTATRLLAPDLELLARSLDLPFWRLGDTVSAERAFREMVEQSGPSLVEVPLTRSMASVGHQARARVRESVRSAIGERGVQWVRGVLGRGT